MARAGRFEWGLRFLLGGLLLAIALILLLASGGPHAVASRAGLHKSLCVPHRGRHAPPRCRRADGAPRHHVKPFRIKHGRGQGAGGTSDQYLPWETGLRIRLSQGNRSPCGWSHAPPFCNSVGAYSQYGWDFLLPYGANIHAPAGGVVQQARRGCRGSASWGCNGGYGNTVTIEVPGGNCERFEHLSRVDVRPGQPVQRYDVIGAVGSSGNSTGTHLHYQREVCSGRYAGIAIPSSFIEAGVPVTNEVVTSQNRPGSGGQTTPQYHVIGPKSGLDIHSGPSTSSPVTGRLSAGAPVAISCQTRGDTVGNSNVWDSIGAGAYVPDFYISTPADGSFSPGLTPCTNGGGGSGGTGGGLPSLDGGAHDTSFEHDDPFGSLNGGTNQQIYCGNGLAHHGSCYLEVNGQEGRSFAQDFAASPVPGQCFALTTWLRSASAPSFSGVLAIWARNLASDQSGSVAFSVGRAWTPVTVAIRVPHPRSGPAWSSLRGQLYLHSPGELDWDLTRWFGPFSC